MSTAQSCVRELIKDDPAEMPPLTQRLAMEAKRTSDEWPRAGRNPLLYMARANDLAAHIGGGTYHWRHTIECGPSMVGYGQFLERCRLVAGSIQSTLTYSGLDWWQRMDRARAEGREYHPRSWSSEWTELQREFARDLKLLALVDIWLRELSWEFRTTPCSVEFLTEIPEAHMAFAVSQGVGEDVRSWARESREPMSQALRYHWDRAQILTAQGYDIRTLWTYEWDAGAHERAHLRLELATKLLEDAIDGVKRTIDHWNYSLTQAEIAALERVEATAQ